MLKLVRFLAAYARPVANPGKDLGKKLGKDLGERLGVAIAPKPGVGRGEGTGGLLPGTATLAGVRVAVVLAVGLWAAPVAAQSLANPVAVFSGLDKITGRIITFDVYINETVQFGALQITPRVCYRRPPDQVQRTSSFIEVDQVSLQRTIKRIFTGWMFADSPALNAIDNAVYDVWLVDCKSTSDVPPPDSR